MKMVKTRDVATSIVREPGAKNVTLRRLIDTPDGADRFVMSLFEMSENAATPPHHHDWEHELYVLDGSVSIELPDENRKVPMSQGDVAFIPRGEPHGFVTGPGERAQLLLVAPAERPPTSNVFLTDTPYEFEVGSSDGDATRADAASREGWPDEDVSRLHRLMMAYVSSKALFSALELDVFNALSKEPVTAEELGAKIGLEGRPARNLLLALHGERLVRLEDGRYHLEPVASRYLVSSSPTYLGALIEHQDRHFTRFTKLTEALRNNRAVREGDNYDPDAFGGPESFIELTRAASHLMAAGVVAAADLTHHNRVVDLGCASGAYTMALAKANPNVRFTAVDNPTVCAITSDVVDQAGLAGRITVRPADIFKDTFPDCDAAFISNAIEGFDREHAQALVSHIYDWLPAGGELFVHSHMWERATSPFPFIIGLILVCNNTAGGEAYGEAVNREWLETAGFEVREVTPVSPISTLVRAVK